MLEKILKELKTQPLKYFEREQVIALEQASVYSGLYWNTYRYKVDFSNTRKYIYIKVHKEAENLTNQAKRSELQQRVGASYENLSRVYASFKAFSGYSVIKPIACFPEWIALITEESPGIDLWTLIRKKAKFYPSKTNLHLLKKYCRACGKWLAIFQQITRRPDLDPCEFDSFIETLDSSLSTLIHKQNSMFSNEFRQRIIGFCQQLILSIPDEDRMVSGLHYDFAPVNILIHEDKITVLDLEDLRNGVIYYDSIYFYYHLNLLLETPIYRPATVAKLQKAFIEGFGTLLDLSKNVVTLCLIHNVIDSLLYLSHHREHVSWYKKLYDKLLYKKHIHWLQNVCRF